MIYHWSSFTTVDHHENLHDLKSTAAAIARKSHGSLRNLGDAQRLDGVVACTKVPPAVDGLVMAPVVDGW